MLTLVSTYPLGGVTSSHSYGGVLARSGRECFDVHVHGTPSEDTSELLCIGDPSDVENGVEQVTTEVRACGKGGR
jgi:hypothetical protein